MAMNTGRRCRDAGGQRLRPAAKHALMAMRLTPSQQSEEMELVRQIEFGTVNGYPQVGQAPRQ